jgi:ribosomal protein S18 acetylase RimI-like enzyme
MPLAWRLDKIACVQALANSNTRKGATTYRTNNSKQKVLAMSMSSSASTQPANSDAKVSEHALDNVIWSALTTQHRSIAAGDAFARRYPAAFGRFGALADTSSTSFESFARLFGPGDQLALFTVNEIRAPGQFAVDLRKNMEQMVGSTTPGWVDNTQIVPLDATDADDMMALVELTKPGPFATRTHELGRYLGIRVDGRLAAMVGERMHLDGYTEVSAVCVHPDYRGRGYARDLIVVLSNAILARGEVPFLHVFSDNESAFALYRKLGFTIRKTLQLTLLRVAHPDESVQIA